jgi:hypothetical protein
MGAAARHRRKFLEEHPRCAFCAGKAVATTIEHCPPRAMFQFRLWPEGFEFPSCEPCNQGSDDEDLLIAMLARMDPFELKGDLDGKQVGLMKAVNRQFPGLFEKMKPSAAEARRSNRELGLQPPPGQTHQETGAVKVTKEFHDAVCVFARKLSKGIYYREAGAVFPDDGCLLLTWFTNADILRSGKYPAFDALKELAGVSPPLQRGGTYLNDQFEYKLSISPDRDVFVLQARFGHSFGVVIFGSTLVGKLEGMITNLRAQTERNGPFAVLQSPVLKT